MTSIGTQNIPINTQMQANMPAPSVQNANTLAGGANIGQNAAPKTEVINDSFSYSEAPLNVGVLEGPSNYSKTPISDEIERRALSSPREKMPVQNKNANKKTKTGETALNNSKSEPLPSYTSKKQNTSGNLSAIFALGSMILVALLTIPKGISKIIKHK